MSGAAIRVVSGNFITAQPYGIRDGVDFALMEAELIEPSLFLSLDPEAPGRFARARSQKQRHLGYQGEGITAQASDRFHGAGPEQHGGFLVVPFQEVVAHGAGIRPRTDALRDAAKSLLAAPVDIVEAVAS